MLWRGPSPEVRDIYVPYSSISWGSEDKINTYTIIQRTSYLQSHGLYTACWNLCSLTLLLQARPQTFENGGSGNYNQSGISGMVSKNYYRSKTFSKK